MNGRLGTSVLLHGMIVISLSCGLVPATQRSLPLQSSPDTTITLDDIDSAERDLVFDSRLPASELLPEQTEALFNTADELKASLLSQAIDDLRAAPVQIHLARLQGSAVGLVLGTMAAAAMEASERPEGEPRTSTQHDRMGAMAGEVRVTVSRSGSRIVSEVEVILRSEDGALEETASGRLELNVCPEASGNVVVSLSLQGQTDASGQGGTATGQFSLSGTLTGHVNDQAVLAGYDEELAVSTSARVTLGQADPREQSLEATVGRSFEVTDGKHVAGEARGEWTGTVNRETVGKTLDGSERIMIGVAIVLLENHAQGLWQNGYCLEITADGVEDRNEVARGSSTSFTARVTHKFEGGDLNVPIEGTLSGKESLDPQGKSQAPVHYAYEAPQESESWATVALETRSRRGVAKRTLDFNTGTPNYQPIAPAYDWSGIVCNLEEAFSLSYSFASPMAGIYDTGSYAFVPSGPTSGKVTLRETLRDPAITCEFTASGTYSVAVYTTGESQVDLIMDLSGPKVCGEETRLFETQYRILLVPVSDPSCR